MKSIIKSSIVILFLFFLISLDGFAQKKFVKGENKFKIGGLGYFSFGYSFPIGGQLKTNLENSFLLNSSLPPFAFSIGGGGYLLFERKFIISGYGFGLKFQNVINKSNEMGFNGGGGGFSLGYIAYNRLNWMIYPSVGFGGMSTTMNIRNTADSLIYFGDYEMALNSDTDFELSQAYLDIGVSAYKFIQLNRSLNNAAGIAFGFSFGYIAGFGENIWQDPNGNDVGGINPGKTNMIYIKISIGGGGFLLR
jgi:hypothetical protein